MESNLFITQVLQPSFTGYVLVSWREDNESNRNPTLRADADKENQVKLDANRIKAVYRLSVKDAQRAQHDGAIYVDPRNLTTGEVLGISDRLHGRK